MKCSKGMPHGHFLSERYRVLQWIPATLVLFWFLGTPAAFAIQWTSGDAGDFLDANNWGGSVPNGTGAVATISTQPTNIFSGFNLNGTMTLGVLDYSNALQRALSGGGVLQFAASSGNALYRGQGKGLDLQLAGVSLLSTTEFNLQNAYSVVQSNVGGGGGLLKTGSGTLYLQGNNSYSGGTTILEGFVLGKSLTNRGSNSSFGTGDFTLGNGVLYYDQGPSTSTDRSITLLADAGFIGLVNSTVTLNGAISGAGSLKIYAGGTLVLGAGSSASYQGDTQIWGSILELGGNERIPDTSNVQLNSFGGSSVWRLNDFNETIGSLSGDGGLEMGSGNLTTGGSGIDSWFNGTLTGSGDFTKTGTGTMYMTAGSTDTHSGNTYVDAGVLHVQGGKIISTGSLTVSKDLNAELKITDGGKVETQGAELGVDGGTGTVTVQANSELKVHGAIEMGINNGYGILRADGVNAKVSADSITVGGSLLSYDGSGGIDIKNGATVAVHDLLQVWDTGQVTMKEYNDGGRLIVTTGDPSLVPTRGGLYVGGGVGLGQMVIENGGSVNTSIARIDGVDGTYVEVRGHRVDESSGQPKDVVATLYIQQSLDSLVVGDSGSGRLGINDSGWVHYGDAVLGNAAHSYGGVLVTGSYTSVDGEPRAGYFDGQYLTVGGAGSGELRIENGGYAYNLGITIGSASTGVGAVTITGPGPSLDVFQDIMVGDAGNGKLQIFQGAAVTIANTTGSGLTIGNQPGSTGLVVVSGHNNDSLNFVPTKLDAGKTLTVGVQGTGVLVINDEAEVKSKSAIIGANSGADGQVYVTGATWGISNQLLIGGGGKALLKLDDGGLVLAQTAIIGPHGELGGNGGKLQASVINDGRVAPGNSPGLLTIDGDYTQSATGQLEIQIAGVGAGQFDQLIVTGNANLDGTLAIEFLDGYVPHQGDTLNFLVVGGSLAGDFSQIIFPNLEPGFRYDLRFSNGVYSLTALNNATLTALPEPAALSLLLIGLPLFLRKQRGLKDHGQR